MGTWKRTNVCDPHIHPHSSMSVLPQFKECNGWFQKWQGSRRLLYKVKPSATFLLSVEGSNNSGSTTVLKDNQEENEEDSKVMYLVIVDGKYLLDSYHFILLNSCLILAKLTGSIMLGKWITFGFRQMAIKMRAIGDVFPHWLV